MPQSPQNPQHVALDTNFLLDLANENEAVLDCKTTIERRIQGVCFAVLPTVIQELSDLSELTSGAGSQTDWLLKQRLASKALDSILNPWGFRPHAFVPVMNAVVEQTALRLRNRGLLPYDQRNDSLIIAEAAALPALFLISSDSHIRDIDQAALNIELASCHLSPVLIASPPEIVHKFFQY